MSNLTKGEIEERLLRGKLIRNPRRLGDGNFDIEVDSYDLGAGTAVWKQPAEQGSGAEVRTLECLTEEETAGQPTVTVQPGQMIFVITREDVLMPTDICGTVYSRNNLALAGILALNAGHVDPGYEGPIAIRLINLRSTPWTLTLGDGIFTITFQTVDPPVDEQFNYKRRVTQVEMIRRVCQTADAALSNALYDLYAFDVDRRLNEFKASALADFTRERDERWVKREEILSVILRAVCNNFLKWLVTSIVIIAGIATVVSAVLTVLQYLTANP